MEDTPIQKQRRDHFNECIKDIHRRDFYLLTDRWEAAYAEGGIWCKHRALLDLDTRYDAVCAADWRLNSYNEHRVMYRSWSPHKYRMIEQVQHLKGAQSYFLAGLVFAALAPVFLWCAVPVIPLWALAFRESRKHGLLVDEIRQLYSEAIDKEIENENKYDDRREEHRECYDLMVKFCENFDPAAAGEAV